MNQPTKLPGGSNRHRRSTGRPPDETPAQLLRQTAAQVAHIAAASGGPVAVEGMPLYMALLALGAVLTDHPELAPKMHWPCRFASSILGEDTPR